ncbi:unnamed protein product [Pedinophyceae sp. YPF-701]|nr:unnamed protein product [Pedinophyceae sp. YPF-701]
MHTTTLCETAHSALFDYIESEQSRHSLAATSTNALLAVLRHTDMELQVTADACRLHEGLLRRLVGLCEHAQARLPGRIRVHGPFNAVFRTDDAPAVASLVNAVVLAHDATNGVATLSRALAEAEAAGATPPRVLGVSEGQPPPGDPSLLHEWRTTARARIAPAKFAQLLGRPAVAEHIVDLRIIGVAMRPAAIRALQAAPQLQTLQLDKCAIGAGPGASELGNLVAKLTDLRSLSLAWNNLLDVGVVNVVRMLSRDNIASLDVRCNSFGRAGCLQIANLLWPSHMRSLCLAGNPIWVDEPVRGGSFGTWNKCSREQLASYLEDGIWYTGLERLDLSMTGTKMSDLLPGDTCPESALRALDLSSNDLRDDGARAIARALSEDDSGLKHTLEVLRLGRNAIGGCGTAALASALRNNTTLRELSLAQNQIGHRGAGELGALLACNSALQVLDVRSCGFGDKGTKKLVQGVQAQQRLGERSRLRRLDVSGNEFGWAREAALAELSGTLQVVGLEGGGVAA